MKLFDVYQLFDINPVRAEGSWIWDDKGERYLDLYGGHAVISIGHSHPQYVQSITEQLKQIGFYSNSVRNDLQEKLAEKLGRISGYVDYQLFLCNSGAEANENALKLASFVTGRKKVIAFKNAFHGRTSGAVAATDNPKIVAPFNANHEIVFVDLNDEQGFSESLTPDVAAVIVEGIQGVAGIRTPDDAFMQLIQKAARENRSLFIVDEVQSGYGRTGKFFAHQHARVEPDLITVAKGMGNGFPIGGVLISPKIKPWAGMLGTTFGGNYLACAAGLAVLDVIESEQLMENAGTIGNLLLNEIAGISSVHDVRGRGLMIGFDLPESSKTREHLLYRHRIFTGEAKPNTIRLLPSLGLKKEEASLFISALKQELS
ncbi:MAG TPA: aminotransferase class III-fold pyridoxal phosphate-dependent enzyme [Chryseosolibacter sp.]|nr:aminotransferase class III-fold pyridoxal phosphate-dependent enzyme [Chryseosolibacter sp.]